MSTDRALQITYILESTAQGVALVDEYRLRQAHQALCHAIDAYEAMRVRVINTWFAEQYPELQCHITSKRKPVYNSDTFTIETQIIVDNPDALSKSFVEIQEEMGRYLDSLV